MSRMLHFAELDISSEEASSPAIGPWAAGPAASEQAVERLSRNGSSHLSDLECSRPFSGVLGADPLGEAVSVAGDGVASRAVVAADVQDEGVAARADRGRFAAEVAGPLQRLQVGGADAQPHRDRGITPADLFDDRIDLRADGRETREQLVMAARGSGELLNHVDRGRQARVLESDDLDEHAPWVVAKTLARIFWPGMSAML